MYKSHRKSEISVYVRPRVCFNNETPKFPVSETRFVWNTNIDIDVSSHVHDDDVSLRTRGPIRFEP